MIKFKKAAVYLCCGAMIASLAGCGSKASTKTEQPTSAVETSVESTESVSVDASAASTDTESEAELLITGPKKITGYSQIGNVGSITCDDGTAYAVSEDLYNELKEKSEESSDAEYMITSRKMTDAEMDEYKENAAANSTLLIGSLVLYSVDQDELGNLTDEKIHELAVASISSDKQNDEDAITYAENAIRMAVEIQQKYKDNPDISEEEYYAAMKDSEYYDSCIKYAVSQLEDTGVSEELVSYEISE